MSCPYRYIFGVPKQGFHAARFLGVSLNDTLGTIGLGFLFSYLCNVGILKSIVFMFVFGEVLHYLFGVQTAFLSLLRVEACSSKA